MRPEELLPLSPQAFHILVALADSDRHGYGIMRDVAERTGNKLILSAGTLYGAIQRLLEQGLVLELPGADRRRTYRLTAFGRKVVKAEAARMAELVEQAREYGLAPRRA
jgi:DNA-binding PadR family transcriptional regulator